VYPSCVLIGPAILRRMYVAELRSAEEIAVEFRCSATTVFRHLRRFKIPIRRRGPYAERARTPHRVTTLSWSAKVAYVVGLIATDGNLGRTKPSITIVSKDVDLLETVRGSLGLTTEIRPHRGPAGHDCHHVSWYDRSLYQWLREIGLTPAKSLTLRPLTVPDEYFVDFFRGCIDGDGSIVTYTDRYHVAKSNRYVYERLYVSIVSASYPFIEWLQATVRHHTNMQGSITADKRVRNGSFWRLRYAKAESLQLLRWMYYSPGIPALDRKRTTAERFLRALGYAPVRTTGRPRAGWIYNVDRDTTANRRIGTTAGVE
jgi:hypothetical protein